MVIIRLAVCFVILSHRTTVSATHGSRAASHRSSFSENTEHQSDPDTTDSPDDVLYQNSEFHDPNWTPFPNMVAGMRGYNMLQGNPFHDLRDPGFVGQLFVPASMKMGRMELEGGITANDLTACKRSMQSKSFTSVESLRTFMEETTKSGVDLQVGTETDVSVSGDVQAGEVEMSTTIPPMFTRAWGRSTETQETSDFFTDKQGMLSISLGYCEEYEMFLDKQMPPPFSSMFIGGLIQLYDVKDDNDNKKAAAFKSFIKQFGTHYLSEVVMGAQFLAETRFSKLARETLSAEKLNDCNYKKGARVFGIQGEQDANNCKEEDIEQLNELGTENSEMSVRTKGSRPTDMENWVEQEFNPVPLKFKLVPIVNLFKDDYFKEFGVNDVDRKGRRGKGKAIKAEDILKWFLPIYNSEKEFCNIMGIDCSQKLGCGLSDTCPVDTVCDRSQSISSTTKSCSEWSVWECTAQCGRGYSETRSRQCDGCIGSTLGEVHRMCKAKLGCYGFSLKITKSIDSNPRAPVPESSKFSEQFSACILFKVTTKVVGGTKMALFNFQSEGNTNILKLFVLTGSEGGLEVHLGESVFVFENFKDSFRWQHICVIWKHQWSIFGEATLYVNGLFSDSKSVTLSKLLPQNAALQSPKKIESQKPSAEEKKVGSLIIGGHINDDDTTIEQSGTFLGILSGLYLYKRVLTAADVQEAYEGYAPTGEEIFMWDSVLNPQNSIGDDVEIVHEVINPSDVVSESEGRNVFKSEPKGWEDAENTCQSMEGHLISVQSEKENKELLNELQRRDLPQLWIGLSSDNGGKWKWSGHDESSLPYVNWENKPTSQESKKTCIAINSDGKWKSVPCEERHHFACHVGQIQIALKNGKQSSIFSFSGSKSYHGAPNAYDGDLDTYINTDQNKGMSWWKAELEKEAIVTKVEWFPTSKWPTYDQTEFTLFTSMDEDEQWQKCCHSNDAQLQPDKPKKKELICTTPQRAKFIKIQRDAIDRPFAFSEVKVYGRFPDEVARFGRPTDGEDDDGRSYIQGYVEIRHHRDWGTICDNSFSNNDNGAKVVCRMMGYVDGAYADGYKQKDVAKLRKRDVFLNNVVCNGNEDSVFDCTHDNIGSVGDCRNGTTPHDKDVGIRCYRTL